MKFQNGYLLLLAAWVTKNTDNNFYAIFYLNILWVSLNIKNIEIIMEKIINCFLGWLEWEKTANKPRERDIHFLNFKYYHFLLLQSSLLSLHRIKIKLKTAEYDRIKKMWYNTANY